MQAQGGIQPLHSPLHIRISQKDENGDICSSGASSQLCAHLPPRMEHANVGAAAEFPSASIRERGWKTKVASCCPQQTFKECQS